MRGLWFVEKGRAEFVQSDLEEVLRLVLKGSIHPRELLRDVVSIDDAIAVYDTLRDEKYKLLGTVFDWTGEHGLDA